MAARRAASGAFAQLPAARPFVRESGRAGGAETFANEGQNVPLHFYRDSSGNEADLVLENGAELTLVEIESARSIAPDVMSGIKAVQRALQERVAGSALVYDGDEIQRRSEYEVVPCRDLRRWLLDA